MGWVYYALKNYEEAITSFEKAISMGQTNIGYYYQLGLSYAYLKKCDQARPWFEKALAVEPDLGPAKDGLKSCQQ
jgi:tetratricopeptide (TPR) repeat protein